MLFFNEDKGIFINLDSISVFNLLVARHRSAVNGILKDYHLKYHFLSVSISI